MKCGRLSSDEGAHKGEWVAKRGGLPALTSRFPQWSVLAVGCVISQVSFCLPRAPTPSGPDAAASSQVAVVEQSPLTVHFQLGPEIHWPDPTLLSVDKTLSVVADPHLSIMRLESAFATNRNLLGVNRGAKLTWDPSSTDTHFKVVLDGAQGAVLTSYPQRWERIEIRAFLTATEMVGNTSGVIPNGSNPDALIEKAARDGQRRLPDCQMSGGGLATEADVPHPVFDLTVVVGGRYASAGQRPNSVEQYPFDLETPALRSELEAYAATVAYFVRKSVTYNVERKFDPDSGCPVPHR